MYKSPMTRKVKRNSDMVKELCQAWLRSRVRPTEDEAEFVIEYKVNHEDEISQVPGPLKL